MDSGICYIKSDYLIPDVKITSSDGSESTEKITNKREHQEASNNGVASGEKTFESANKYQKTGNGKKDRKRGQNKHRPIFKEDRTLYLCHSLINGPDSAKCPLEKCRYVHDLQKYLESKADDLGKHCHVFDTKGYCPRGVTCRFARAHLDENGNNIKAANFDERKAATTCNGITSELQVRLRKREYDFSRCKKLVAKFEKLRDEAKKQQKSEEAISTPINDIVAETIKTPDTFESEKTTTNQLTNDKSDGNAKIFSPNKPVGCVIDQDNIKGRDIEHKPPVDFANKLVLSPLTTVGNLPFRRICKEFGADITCGEMACAVPLVKGLTQEWALTKRHESEDIFGVQLCGNNPNIISQAAQLMQETANVDYIDLNIGCPIDLIYQQGGGSALMRRTNILELTVRTCSALSPQIPFTVKMRTGVYADKSVAHELAPLVEEWGAAAVTLHGRSREQRYTKNANWQYIEECAAKVKRIPVIGNGDILNFEDYNERMQLAPHVSSVMIGRGALIKPWIFKEIKEQKHWDPSSSERFDMLKKYVNYGLEHWGSDTKGVENTRRFLLEWQSFLYRYIPYDLLVNPPQKINQRPQKYRGRDEMETLMSSANSTDWVKLSEMLLGPVPEGFTFLPKHKANAY